MSAPVSAPCILIVDDTEVNLLLLRSVLDAEGFRTLVASDGATARQLSRSAAPDLILLDVVMPGESVKYWAKSNTGRPATRI
jgi:CheY-like chemotaxis protein